MPHIDLPEQVPGIRSGFAFRPETAEPLCHLADVLLRGESPLTRGERELIAAFVSTGNDCFYCRTSHGVFAGLQLPGGRDTVEAVLADHTTAPIDPKLRTLLDIAAKVREGGKQVMPDDVARAREAGATDVEIHDTVLIAAAFCMFNRYVDGLAMWAPTDMADYEESGAAIVARGYVAARLG